MAKKPDNGNKIVIDGVAPVTHCEIDLPPDGVGVLCLVGTHGTGKDRTLAAITRLITGDKSYGADVEDNAEKGKIAFAGGGLSVGQKIVPTGSCEYTGINPSLVLGLVDPPFKGEDAREAYMIESLIDLAKVPADCQVFRSLCADGEEYEELCTEDLCSSKSLVEMCDKFARNANAKALATEKEATQEAANALAKRGANADLDLDAESDAEKLQSLLESAIQHESSLKEKDKSATDAEDAASEAKKKLAEAEANYKGPSVEKATEDWIAANAASEKANLAVEDIKKLLSQAEAAAIRASHNLANAVAAGIAARQHENTVKAWRESLAAAVPQRPSHEDLAKAAQSVAEARKSVEMGGIIRRAKEQQSEVLEHAEKAEALTKKAERLRLSAKGTDDILSQAVAKANCPLKVYRGRLVMKTDRSDRERFTELSGGEKLQVALEIALKTVPKGKKALLPLTPRTWSELNADSEEKIANMARENGVLIVTGKVTTDAVLGATSL